MSSVESSSPVCEGVARIPTLMTVVFLLAADKANGGIDKDWDFHADIPDRFVPFLESNMLQPRQTHPPLHTWHAQVAHSTCVSHTCWRCMCTHANSRPLPAFIAAPSITCLGVFAQDGWKLRGEGRQLLPHVVKRRLQGRGRLCRRRTFFRGRRHHRTAHTNPHNPTYFR